MIPSIELNHFAYEDMFCMFCGEQVLFEDDSPAACPHVLFIATSEGGYEHESDLVAAMLPPFHVEDEESQDFGKSFRDRLREANGFPADSFMVEICSPAPAMLEVYVGFSSSIG